MKDSGATSALLITRSKSIARVPWLEQVVGDSITLVTNTSHLGVDAGTIVGCLDEGFLAYARHPSCSQSPPLSILFDRTGTPLDPSRPPDLQAILKDVKRSWSEGMAARARRVMATIQRLRLSKYNHQEGSLDDSGWRRYRILIVDQSIDSRVVCDGGVNTGIFEQMVDSACKSHAETDLIVKIHPDDELTGGKSILRGKIPPGISVVPPGINIWSVLNHVDMVYTVSSQVGLEALMAGKKVVCFGRPFYAGWGLTTDVASAQGEAASLTLEQLVYGVLIKYPIYLHPERRERCEIEEILSYLESALKKQIGFYRSIYTVDLSAAQKGVLTPFLQGHFAENVRHISTKKARMRAFAANEAALFWARGEQPGDDLTYLENRGVTVLRAGPWPLPLVDGESRRPSALQFTKHRLYFDGSRENDLTQLLEKGNFAPELLRRSEVLHQRLLTVMDQECKPLPEPFLKEIAGRSVALVLGHLEGDGPLGVRDGAVRSDRDLLLRVRRDFPETYLVYVPCVGDPLGKGTPAPVETTLYDDIVLPEYWLSCLKRADTVHVTASLCGVQTLVYGKLLYTYGRPFYAGWGLTQDAEIFLDRTKQRSLTELLCVAFILGPTYFDWHTMAVGTPEENVRRHLMAHAQGNLPRRAEDSSRLGTLDLPRHWRKMWSRFRDIKERKKWAKTR